MSPRKPLSNDLRRALNEAAFKGDSTKISRKFFLKHSRDDIVAAMPSEATLHKWLREIAFQEGAAAFKNILYKFKEDEGAVRAILNGFKDDDKYHSEHSGNDDYWGSGSYTPADLEKKRDILREFSADVNRGSAARPPGMKP